jgi:hypothetical protein
MGVEHGAEQTTADPGTLRGRPAPLGVREACESISQVPGKGTWGASADRYLAFMAATTAAPISSVPTRVQPDW